MTPYRTKARYRRTLYFVETPPTPKELYERLVSSSGWAYKTNMEYYLKRDRALVSVLYLMAVRVSEALRLKRSQLTIKEQEITVRKIELSKTRWRGKPRQSQFRSEAWIPLHGERGMLGQLVLDYVRELDPDTRLFSFKEHRAWEIVTALIDDTCHWLRAYGEDFLYEHMNHDILAVADYIKVDAVTLQRYVRKRYTKYPRV